MANAFQGYQFDLLTVVAAVMRRSISAVICEDRLSTFIKCGPDVYAFFELNTLDTDHYCHGSFCQHHQ